MHSSLSLSLGRGSNFHQLKNIFEQKVFLIESLQNALLVEGGMSLQFLSDFLFSPLRTVSSLQNLWHC